MIKALIPVRSGSERVKNKNVRPFCGSTLLELKIKQMMRIPGIDGVVVNSNSDEMLDIAKMCGAETVKRDDAFALSSTPINEVYKNIAEHFDADTMLFVNCTNPLVLDSSISRTVSIFKSLSKTDYDSVNTTHCIKEFMWLDGRPINYNVNDMPRSQDLPKIMALNFAVNVIRTENVIKLKNIIGVKPMFVELTREEATDIDDEIDFDFAEFLYARRMNENINR